jgi:hypothetical protein
MKNLALAGMAALLLLMACGGGNTSGGGGHAGSGDIDAGHTGGAGGANIQECDQSAGISPQAGSGCNTPGETCDIACSPCHMLCSPTHVWEQACATLGCPDTLPQNGDPCDACASPSACTYDLGAACSHKMATASCATDHWEVTAPSCP